MPLHVSSALETDIPRLMEIQFSAFDGDPYHIACNPPGDNTPSIRLAAGHRCLEEWHETPGQHVIKCTDTETGVIMGYGKWNMYEEERPKEQWAKREEVNWCEGREKEIAESFLGATSELREKLWEGRPHCLLAILCVHRDCQRRSAGSAIVKWGLDYAKRVGLPAYLEASPAGKPVYQRLGFQPTGDLVVIPKERWDGEYDYTCVAMLKNLSSQSHSKDNVTLIKESEVLTA